MPRNKNTITKTFSFEGKRYSVSGKTEKEATAKMLKKQQELENGSFLISNSITVGEWAYICYETYRKGKVKEDTYYRYINRLKNCIINKPIGSMQVQKVRHIDCQKCVNEQAGNSDYQIRQTIQMLDFIFRKAVKDDLILKNPAEELERPVGVTNERRELTPQEEKIFLKIAQNDRYMVFLLMYHCGCRPDEARGLEGQDILLVEDMPILHIRGTKNKKADRYVPMPEKLYVKIKDVEPFQPVCPSKTGKHLPIKAFRRAWNSLIREMNIAMGCRVYRNQLIPPYPVGEDLVPYCLRHTFCTNLLKKSIDPRLTQYVMGHKNQETTDIYTHVNAYTIAELFQKGRQRDDSKDDTKCA